jgi:hypothetical protein
MFYSLLCFPSTLNFSSHICQRQRQKWRKRVSGWNFLCISV